MWPGAPGELRFRLAHDIKTYPEAGHSFFNQDEGLLAEHIMPLTPMHLGYHAPSAEDAWRRMLSFFEAHLAS